MRGYRARCLRDRLVMDAFGVVMRLVGGKRYLISRERQGRVTVFSEPMITAPSCWFKLPKSGDHGRQPYLPRAAA